jgi:hypothetical protein
MGDLLEELAALAHEQWSGWMQYMFSKCATTESGEVIIPKHLVERWQRQMRTPYGSLLEAEKLSDREEAQRMVKVVGPYLKMGDGV